MILVFFVSLYFSEFIATTYIFRDLSPYWPCQELDQRSFSWQVLEYHPEPWDQWVLVGNILGRFDHAVVSIGPQQLPCLAGDVRGLED